MSFELRFLSRILGFLTLTLVCSTVLHAQLVRLEAQVAAVEVEPGAGLVIAIAQIEVDERVDPRLDEAGVLAEARVGVGHHASAGVDRRRRLGQRLQVFILARPNGPARGERERRHGATACPTA